MKPSLFDVTSLSYTVTDHSGSRQEYQWQCNGFRNDPSSWMTYYLWRNHRIDLSVWRVLQYILRMYVKYLFAHLNRRLEKLRLGLDNSLPSSSLWLCVQSLPTNWKKTTHLDYPRLTWRPSRLVVQQIMDVLTSLLDFSNVLLGWFFSTGRSYWRDFYPHKC